MGMDMDMDTVEKDIIRISLRKNLFIKGGKREINFSFLYVTHRINELLRHFSISLP